MNMSASALLVKSMELQIEALNFLKVVLEQIKGDRKDSPPSPAFDVDNDLRAWSRCDATEEHALRSVRTIAQKARASICLRFIDIMCRLLSVEQNVCHSVNRYRRIQLRVKDSVELRNISRHMTQDRRTDQDMKDFRNCLMSVVVSLLSSHPYDSNEVSQITGKLKDIVLVFPDI